MISASYTVETRIDHCPCPICEGTAMVDGEILVGGTRVGWYLDCENCGEMSPPISELPDGHILKRAEAVKR